MEDSDSINNYHVESYFSIVLFPVFTLISTNCVGDNYFSKIKRVWNLLQTLYLQWWALVDSNHRLPACKAGTLNHLS